MIKESEVLFKSEANIDKNSFSINKNNLKIEYNIEINNIY